MAKKAKEADIILPSDAEARVNSLSGIPGCIKCIREFVNSFKTDEAKTAQEVAECLLSAMGNTGCLNQNPNKVAFQIVEKVFIGDPVVIQRVKLAWHEISPR